ncbi:hypothetical protein Ate02nite_03440 [Paractinoplanes tereljensis]|uniref:Uncharacterized protein n=2 Tax=Paractinoplanes tereljensis TaxID=571912 RepID=A0A919TPZ3_9ACTN|nr:hypothetical protein Ate02nite_03440 [Actinoplanes tereljensis]
MKAGVPSAAHAELIHEKLPDRGNDSAACHRPGAVHGGRAAFGWWRLLRQAGWMSGAVVFWDFEGTLAERPGRWRTCLVECLAEVTGGASARPPAEPVATILA